VQNAVRLLFKARVDQIALFYPNMITLRCGLCYRRSICRLSVVCNSVTHFLNLSYNE